MIKAGPLAASLLAALILLAAPACVKKPPLTPRIRPLAAVATPQAAAAEESSLTLFGTLDLGLRYLDPDTRARYLKEVAGQAEDPFRHPDPGRGEIFLVFLFSIENRGTEAALISPTFASLVDRKLKVNLAPIDARELASILAANPAYTPEVSRRLHPATININPGQRLARLLVFPAMDRTPKTVEVIFPSVMSGTLIGDAHFPFSVTWEPVPAF